MQHRSSTTTSCRLQNINLAVDQDCIWILSDVDVGCGLEDVDVAADEHGVLIARDVGV